MDNHNIVLVNLTLQKTDWVARRMETVEVNIQHGSKASQNVAAQTFEGVRQINDQLIETTCKFGDGREASASAQCQKTFNS